MKLEEKQEWIAALRSGEYEQGFGQLEGGGKFCCLGVKCNLDVKAGRYGLFRKPINSYSEVFEYGTAIPEGTEPFWRSDYIGRNYPTPAISEAWGLTYDMVRDLGRKNDSRQWDFNRIADYLEEIVPVTD